MRPELVITFALFTVTIAPSDEVRLSRAHKAAIALAQYIHLFRPKWIPNYRIILSHWALESNWMESRLAREANNLAGIKWSPRLKHLAEPYGYTDWENVQSTYLKVEDLSHFPEAYFKFLKRKRYWPIEKYAGDPEGFIKHLARRGYCGSFPGVHRKDYKEDLDYRIAVATAYVETVLKIYRSEKMDQFIESLMLPWRPVGPGRHPIH